MKREKYFFVVSRIKYKTYFFSVIQNNRFFTKDNKNAILFTEEQAKQLCDEIKSNNLADRAHVRIEPLQYVGKIK